MVDRLSGLKWLEPASGWRGAHPRYERVERSPGDGDSGIMTISLQQWIMFGVLCIHVPECTRMSLALSSPAYNGYTPRGPDIVTLELGFRVAQVSVGPQKVVVAALSRFVRDKRANRSLACAAITCPEITKPERDHLDLDAARRYYQAHF